LIQDGFTNVIPILDNMNELASYEDIYKSSKLKVGIRIAAEEEPNFDFYTSRLGIRYTEIIDYYKNVIKKTPNIEVKLLHFFH